MTLVGLISILQVGAADKEAGGPGAVNAYAVAIEQCGGLAGIRRLQENRPSHVVQKATDACSYFPHVAS